MGKQTTAKKEKEKAKEKRRQSTKEDEEFADKISRVFYSWMKKKRPTMFVTIKSEHYEIRNLICEGTFGKVYMAVNLETHLTAAAKIEAISAPCPQLFTEFKILEKLGCDHPGFIKVYHFGHCDNYIYNVLIMELLGPDLDDLFITCKNIFSLKTVMMIALQTLEIMRHCHKKLIIYRDIKPENFCIGHKYKNKEKFVYIIDFGLSKIMDKVPSVVKGENALTDYLIGTARYMSVNAHYAYDQSHRDDLESLGYMYVYFLKGRLPWMGLSKTNPNAQDHYKSIAKMKAELTPEELATDCDELVKYLTYVRNLEYMEVPDYDYLIGLMLSSMRKNHLHNDSIYDWTPIMNRRYLGSTLIVDPDD